MTRVERRIRQIQRIVHRICKYRPPFGVEASKHPAELFRRLSSAATELEWAAHRLREETEGKGRG